MSRPVGAITKFPSVPAMIRCLLDGSKRLPPERCRYRSKTSPFTIMDAAIWGEKLPAALGVPRKINPIITPRIVPLHFFPVNETRIAKNAGNRKKRSNDRVTGLSSMLDMYPYAVKRAVRTATKATYLLVEVPLRPRNPPLPRNGWLMMKQ